jgi:hypothetical protein
MSIDFSRGEAIAVNAPARRSAAAVPPLGRLWSPVGAMLTAAIMTAAVCCSIGVLLYLG